MTTTFGGTLLRELRHEANELRRNWYWFVLLGVLLIILGCFALGSVVVATLATTIAIGVLLLASGIAESVGAFWSRGWSGFFFHLLAGVLSVVVGLMFLRAPMGAMLALTLLLACFLMVSGIFNIVAALTYRFSGWGCPLAAGIVDVILGIMIWMEWPAAALWVIGMFLGISLIFRGFNWIGLGLLLRMPRGAARAEE